MTFNCKKPSRNGFTLMEVLCILVIISVMATVTLQEAASFHATEQIFATASKLVADVRMARYRAMEYQGYTRVKVSPYGDGWQAQELCDSVSGEAVEGEPYLPTHNDWQSIIEEDMRYIEPSMVVTSDPDPPPEIYFSPDGSLVDTPSFNAPPIGIVTFKFTYNDMPNVEGAEVQISPAGVIESESFYSEKY